MRESAAVNCSKAQSQYHRIYSSTRLFVISLPSVFFTVPAVVCVVITWIKGCQHTVHLCWTFPLLISTIWPPVPPLLDAFQTWSRPPRRPMWTSPRWPTRWWRGPATPAGWWFSKLWSLHTTSWCMATRWGYSILFTHTPSTYLCWLLVSDKIQSGEVSKYLSYLEQGTLPQLILWPPQRGCSPQ